MKREQIFWAAVWASYFLFVISIIATISRMSHQAEAKHFHMGVCQPCQGSGECPMETLCIDGMCKDMYPAKGE